MTSIRLSNEFAETVKKYAEANMRSVPKQVEYWAKIGKIAEENPDLPYEFILGILTAQDEKDMATPFEFA